MSDIQRYKADFEILVNRGEGILQEIKVFYNANQGRQALINPNADYQSWYTESHALIHQLLPGRLAEFEQIYKGDGTGRYETIQQWLNGHLSSFFEHPDLADNVLRSIMTQFQNQLSILKSIRVRFESTLYGIRHLVQADLFDSELDAARELVNRGFLRAAGAVSGVVLERHLNQVAENHNIEIRKKNCTIGDFNEILKKEEVLDVPEWRQIQWLGDIRNRCTHSNKEDPSREDVERLIDCVERVTKNLS